MDSISNFLRKCKCNFSTKRKNYKCLMDVIFLYNYNLFAYGKLKTKHAIATMANLF